MGQIEDKRGILLFVCSRFACTVKQKGGLLSTAVKDRSYVTPIYKEKTPNIVHGINGEQRLLGCDEKLK